MKLKSVTIVLGLVSIISMSHSCRKTDKQLFTSIGPSQSGITFSNTLIPSDSLNIIEYLYYYNGAGVATGDINNDGLPDIYLASNQQGNKLYLNKGDLKFEDITATAQVTCPGEWNTGVSMVDINGDGWLDIYVCQVGVYKSIRGRNQLFINNKDLTFTERAHEYGLDIVSFSTQAAWLDYDRDGDLDMYLLCHSVHATDTYKDTSIRRVVDTLKGDRLLRNESNGSDRVRFINVSQEAGILSSPIGYGLGVAVADFNNDGWPDLLIGNDFHENDYLYMNNKVGGFSQSQTKSFQHTSTFSMGNDVADLNHDGKMDILSLDMKPDDEIVFKNSVGADPYDIYQYKVQFGYHYQYPRNTLQINQFFDDAGTPYFSEIGQQAGIARTDWSWSPLLADFDHNGLTDIFIANGIAHRPNDLDYLKYFSTLPSDHSTPAQALIDRMPDGRCKNFFFSQTSDLRFENVSASWNPEGPDLSTAAAYADFDLDGDLDLIINRINQPASLLRNQNAAGHSLQLQLIDTTANTSAIGARVNLYSNNIVTTREVYPTRGFQSSSDLTVHFAWKEDKSPDSLIIHWPTGGRQVLVHPGSDTLLRVQKNKISPPRYLDVENTLLQQSSVALDFSHTENSYNDFEREKLLLYKLSTQGPGSAVADINSDGLDDLWLGGARNQAGVVYIQSRGGQLLRLAQPDLDLHAGFEDVDGVWVDVDKDKDVDLIVASAGYEMDKPSVLIDRLYLNDGQGVLRYQPDAMPAIAHMSSCIKPHDIDDDGDIDLFIGGRVSPYYGFNTDSYFLINNGGSFTVSQEPITKGLGMVTDAVWVDIDGQQGDELIVCGEWMPITILMKKGNTWIKKTIPNSDGLWQTLAHADLDGDGDQDLIGGNIGWNHDLKGSAKYPLQLYGADFDQNAMPESLISYSQQGREFSFFNKDELAGQIVLIRKRFTDYHSFAMSSFKDLFPELKNVNHKKVDCIATTLFNNRGDGSFELLDLPDEAQHSMIFAILPTDLGGDKKIDLMLGGNLLEVMPSMGRLDASYGHVLLNQGDLKFRSIAAQKSGFIAPGAVRTIQKINIAGTPNYLIVRNDASTILFY